MNLDIKDLNVAFGNKTIVNNVSLTVKNGEFVGLIGPNGSGKSTLLKSIYRVYSPKSGVMLLNGKNLLNIPIRDVAKNLGVVSQFNNLAFDMTVEQMVLLGRSPHKGLLEIDNDKDIDITHEMLKKVDMFDYRYRSFLTLSGGEKQRVLLARALAQQVKLLILDEPTNHLDIKYQLQILKLTKSLGITVIAALHDLNLAASYCDKLYVMHNGNIAATGAPNEILTKELIKDVYEVDCTIHKYPNKNSIYITFEDF
ncbi:MULTISPECIES: ABC transporter ATP-binding protein [Clostridium]|uniref:ABC transporter ATP-binding protein n=1 Tax=Clostridium TaxID=1485 RepID=UPI00028866B7|nr:MULTISPECIES: ABC transporter ATP-binding protein [Clostridium]